MLHCETCKKDVEIFGISGRAPDAEKIAEGARESARKAGRLILFNPPPIGPYHCPVCGAVLADL